MTLFKAMIPEVGVVALFAGVHLVRWRREWGEPKLLFAEAEGADLLEDERVKALVEAHLRLLDICTFATPSIIYKFLGDDAAVAAGLPLWPEHYNGEPSMRLDLSWAEAAAAPFKEAADG